MSNESTVNYKCPMQQREWLKLILRHWMAKITHRELAIVMFIYDRTIGWGKRWEVITMRHFTHGVVGSDGTVTNRGCGITRVNSVRDCLKNLIEKGPVLVKSYKNEKAYALDFNWNNEMRKPKRLKNNELGGCENASEGVRKRISGGCENAPQRSKQKKEGSQNKKTAVNGGSEKEEIEKLMERTTKRSLSRREELKRKGYNARGKDGGLVPNKDALLRTWADLHRSCFPNHPSQSVTVAAVHALRAYAKDWNIRHRGQEWTDYLKWIFENWTTIIKSSLSWMKDAPPTPAPFVIASSKIRGHIEKDWDKREWMAELRKLSPFDREVQVLMSRGMSEEAAKSMASELQETDRKMEKLAKRERNVELREQELERKRRRVNRKRARKLSIGQMTSEDSAAFEEGLDKLPQSLIRKRPTMKNDNDKEVGQ